MKVTEKTRPTRCSYCHDKASGPLCGCGGAHLECALAHGTCPACGEEAKLGKHDQLVTCEVEGCTESSLFYMGPLRIRFPVIQLNGWILHDLEEGVRGCCPEHAGTVVRFMECRGCGGAAPVWGAWKAVPRDGVFCGWCSSSGRKAEILARREEEKDERLRWERRLREAGYEREDLEQKLRLLEQEREHEAREAKQAKIVIAVLAALLVQFVRTFLEIYGRH